MEQKIEYMREEQRTQKQIQVQEATEKSETYGMLFLIKIK